MAAVDGLARATRGRHGSREGERRPRANLGRMRTRLVSALAVCVSTLAVAAPAQALNPQIAGLQVALRAYGLYLGPVDAVSGPGTVAAVKSFQRRHGLPADGR